MPYLTIGSVTDVPVAKDTPSTKFEQVGDQFRAFSGKMRSSVRAWKKDHPFTTTPLSLTDAAALVTVLEGTQPISCQGDYFGSATDCHVSGLTDRRLWLDGEDKRVLSFVLHEE